MASHQIRCKYEESSQWLEHLSNSFPSRLDGQELILKEPFGEGKMRYEVIQDGLFVHFLDFTVFDTVLVKRESTLTNEIFILDFFLSENVLHQIIDECEEEKYGFQDTNMLFSSSRVSADMKFEANKRMKIVQVLFTKDWFTKNVNLQNYHLKDFFNTYEHICFSENLDHRLKSLIGNLNENSGHKLNLTCHIYQILDHILFNFNGRNLAGPRKKIHGDDTEKLFKAKSYLDQNVQEIVSIQKLCKNIEMNHSKFKRLFPQIFGKPPYRYHLENKMEYGKVLIENERLSVSETAYFIGYDDHGSFTRAFKKHHGFLPSEL